MVEAYVYIWKYSSNMLRTTKSWPVDGKKLEFDRVDR
jgi:hypothetical protein